MPPDKDELRKAMRKLRRRLENPQAWLDVIRVFQEAPIPTFQVFSAFYPVGSEFNSFFLVEHLLRTGKIETVPVAVWRDAPLIFRKRRLEDTPVKDAYGLLGPPAHAPELLPDLIITPLLAFDRRGHRLGQGGGVYDRTLANLRASKPVFVLGLAYAGQEIEEVPAEPHDQRLDAILTETGYIEPAK